jgi:hypothetical protein
MKTTLHAVALPAAGSPFPATAAGDRITCSLPLGDRATRPLWGDTRLHSTLSADTYEARAPYRGKDDPADGRLAAL